MTEPLTSRPWDDLENGLDRIVLSTEIANLAIEAADRKEKFLAPIRAANAEALAFRRDREFELRYLSGVRAHMDADTRALSMGAWVDGEVRLIQSVIDFWQTLPAEDRAQPVGAWFEDAISWRARVIAKGDLPVTMARGTGTVRGPKETFE